MDLGVSSGLGINTTLESLQVLSHTLPAFFFEVIPQVLNGIKIWRLSWPWKNLESMLFKPSSGPLALMLWVIILLKNDAGRVFTIKSKTFLKLILQDLGINLLIHPSINLTCIPDTLLQHTRPHHQRSTSRLGSFLHQPITQALPSLLPAPNPPT